jgi:hypothetical protein
MRADMESDLQPLPEWLRTSLQIRIGEIARVCTERVLEEYQRPDPSPPQTPVLLDYPNPTTFTPSEASSNTIQKENLESASGDGAVDMCKIGDLGAENDDDFSDLLNSLLHDDDKWEFDIAAPIAIS